MTRPVHPSNLTCQVLMFLVQCKGVWATSGTCFYMPSVQQVMPIGTRREVQFRYMRFLQHFGLVGGCNCGCRGDYTPTDEGLDMLASDSLNGESHVREYKKNVDSYSRY